MELTKACGAHMRSNGIDQWDEDYPDIDTLRRDIIDQNLFVMKKDDQVVGVIVLNENQDPEYDEMNWSTEGNSFLVVHRLAISPRFQGQGLARKMMDFAESYAMKNGYKAIRLDTFSQNLRKIL